MIESILVDRELVTDILRYGTMLIFTRFFSSGNILNKKWMIRSINMIIGLSLYHIITKKIFKCNFKNEIVRKVTKTWLKIGSMFIFSQLLSGDDFDYKWFISSLCMIIGFNVMDVCFFKLMPLYKIRNKKLENCIYNSLETIVMSIVSSYLLGKTLDKNWIVPTLYTILGFLTFDIYVINILS